jgi:phosphoglycolate phosphatase
MTVRAVFFDLDGTLVDSLPDLADAVNHMLVSIGRPPLGLSRLRRMLGSGVRELIRRALPSDSPTEIEQGLGLFLEFNTLHIADKSRLYPGVREILEQLTAQGFDLAIISNKNEALSRLILNKLGIDHYFGIICGGDTFEEMKPSPLPLLRVLEQLDIPAESAVMVGDSINDIQAGLRAGIKTIGCSWGYGDYEELREADRLAASCDEVGAFLLQRDN